ncbi:glycosyltransferase family 2 protein [Sinomicrobium weinanense]|uniref:Glycosyltransferase family 2 protein n=1 Tax=Sinomicrobium weinanense TaxID=2842200 RepID=A0A926JTY9_9FLAO|nr:glycosyltransferase family 2 protein [Sinomicrobium weinanense]MBC9797326.1 glycosyltransferase family 2 protein [Sinomicrobium weinanense]MBU3122795.1 glycosyltransferase family 2 protein [Sinomicrobium weinanense]
MKIAVVILNWNGKQLLEQFMPSVLAYSPGADIYVADNASTDDSVRFLRETYPQVQIVQNKVNGGFAKGYNDALKQVDADIFCLLNSDIEVTEGWLGPVMQVFRERPEVAIIQPKILDYKQKDHFEYAGAAGGYIDMLGYPFCRGRVFQTLERDNGQYNDTREIFWATGACMFIRREVFEGLKGFDEDYFAHQEEIDLCWRARNAEHTVLYVGQSHIYHVGGATLHNMNPKKTFLNFRNSLFSITKNAPSRLVFPLIFIRLSLDGIAGIRFIFQLKFGHCLAILRAHVSYYYHLKNTIKKREKGNKKGHYYVIKSIVWAYYIANVRRYPQLVKD